jgi:hypothetical protein
MEGDMMRLTSRCALAAIGILLGFAFAPLSASATPPGPQASWSRLATVCPGTTIVVTLADGRRLQRLMVEPQSDTLVVADLTRIRSRATRDALFNLLRQDPAKFTVSARVEEDGRSMEVVERLDRQSILVVARPTPHRFDPGAVGWLLNTSGPCPNCDAAQTLFGSTVLPSPMPAAERPTTGEVLYVSPTAESPALPDVLTWSQLREWLKRR